MHIQWTKPIIKGLITLFTKRLWVSDETESGIFSHTIALVSSILMDKPSSSSPWQSFLQRRQWIQYATKSIPAYSEKLINTQQYNQKSVKFLLIMLTKNYNMTESLQETKTQVKEIITWLVRGSVKWALSIG